MAARSPDGLGEMLRLMKSAVDVVRSAFEAWNTGDLDAWTAHYHPRVKIGPPEGWPEAEALFDRESWLAQARLLTDSWEEQHIDLDALEEVGGRVLATFTWVTRGKDSGIDFSTQMACLSTVQDNQITAQEYFGDRDEALAALGGEDVHRSP